MSPFIDPLAATGHSSHIKNKQKHPFSSSSPAHTSPLHNKTSIPHHTASLSTSQKEKHLLCKLCNNLHSSPWHTTEMCPLKDPTFIVHKKIRENVMQHNKLHGRINKNYNKDLDLPTANTAPTKATIPTIANSVEHLIPDTLHPSNLSTFDPYASSPPPLEEFFFFLMISPVLLLPLILKRSLSKPTHLMFPFLHRLILVPPPMILLLNLRLLTLFLIQQITYISAPD